MSNDSMDQMKQRILDQYKRMGPESKFTFQCNKNVPCFTNCCGDVNIVLTPYDVLRLKQRLGISSEEFIDKYAVLPFTQRQQHPIVLMQMNKENNDRCFFVTEEGCGIYEDRPWPCRMYPIGVASAEGKDGVSGEEFYFLMEEDHCDGLGSGKEWTVREWLLDQGVENYSYFGDLFKKLTLHPYFQQGHALPPEKMDMFFTALYDLDKFRRFIFESPFLTRFELEDELIEKLKTDDYTLLEFGFRWLHFALFGDKTMTIRQEVIERMQKGDNK